LKLKTYLYWDDIVIFSRKLWFDSIAWL
jgi:hypothetical protein